MNEARHIRTKVIHILITNICNLHCGGCNQLCGHFPSEKEFFATVDEVRRAIELAIAVAKRDWCERWYPERHRHLSIYGGEPTLHPEWARLYEMITEEYRAYPFVILTNGRLFPKSLALSKTGDAEFDFIKRRRDIIAHDKNVFWRIDYKDADRTFVPTLVAPCDVFGVRKGGFYFEQAKRHCQFWKECETLIYREKGYFCINAGPLDHLYYDGAYGWPLDDREHPFDRSDGEVVAQASRFCHRCAFSVAEREMPEQRISRPTLYSIANAITGGGKPLIGRVGFFDTLSAAETPAQTSKRLIIHADDAGMFPSMNAAVIDLFENRMISSASLMVPCPGFTDMAAFARANADADIGIHLTLNCEWQSGNHRWGPVSSVDSVRSLVGPDGRFLSEPRELARVALIEEVEIELRAQIEVAVAAGVRPTHLDTHMYAMFERADLIQLYVQLALEYHVPVFWLNSLELVHKQNSLLEAYRQGGERLRAAGLPILDTTDFRGYDKSPEAKLAYFVEFVRTLRSGTHLLAIHPAYPLVDLRRLSPFVARGRLADAEAVGASEFIEALKSENIEVVTWKALHQDAHTECGPVLSILIPHLRTRKNRFARLLSLLDCQRCDSIEILIDEDGGERSAGAKRNALLNRATGKYVVFIDDDDVVARDYVGKILAAATEGTDCITFDLAFLSRGTIPRLRRQRLGGSWKRESTGRMLTVAVPGLDRTMIGDGVEYETRWTHLCPVKRAIAISKRFPDSSRLEDLAWANDINRLIRTETHIDEVLYFYIKRPHQDE